MMLKEYVITNHCGPLKTMQNTIHSNIKHIICTHLLNVFCDGLELRCLVKPLLGYVLALLMRSSITLKYSHIHNQLMSTAVKQTKHTRS